MLNSTLVLLLYTDNLLLFSNQNLKTGNYISS